MGVAASRGSSRYDGAERRWSSVALGGNEDVEGAVALDGTETFRVYGASSPTNRFSPVMLYFRIPYGAKRTLKQVILE